MPISEEVVWLALDNFRQNNLLADNESVRIDFGGLSRREIIKKVGFASMIALPIITGIIVPKAIQAASRCGTGARGAPVGSRVESGTCGGIPDSVRDGNCNIGFSNQCQSCQARYVTGTCRNTNPGRTYDCVCT